MISEKTAKEIINSLKEIKEILEKIEQKIILMKKTDQSDNDT